MSYREFPAAIKKYFKDVDRIEEIDYFSHDIQSCSFLTSDRTGDFKFIHKSFMEFFVADRIIGKLISVRRMRNNNRIIKELNAVFGITYLSMEICLFVNDMLNLQNKEHLLEIVSHFNDVNNVAKSNIITILSKSGVNLAEFISENNMSDIDISRVDFSEAEFSGKLISGISFANNHFYNVDFDKMVFVGCNFDGASFDSSRVLNSEFYKCTFYASSWKDTGVTGCIFSNEYTQDYYDEDSQELLQSNYSFCNFEESNWQKCIIQKCTFFDCSLADNVMHSISILESTLEHVDFSGTNVVGTNEFSNNILLDVWGLPYAF